MKAQNLPLGEKDYLNPSEAIKYWNLSNRKFYEFLKKTTTISLPFMEQES